MFLKLSKEIATEIFSLIFHFKLVESAREVAKKIINTKNKAEEKKKKC